MDAWTPVLGEGDPQAPHQALLGTSTLSPCSPVGREGPRPSAEGEEAITDTQLLHERRGLSSPNHPPKLLTQRRFPPGACCGHSQP